MTYTIRSASEFDVTDLARALNTSYEDYPLPIHFSPSQLKFFIKAQEIDLNLSVVAVLEGEVIGLAQLARRGNRGWIAGLGVCAPHRRRGVARSLMEALVKRAGKAGVRHLQLEVLHENRAAQSLYLNLGWSVRRELFIWRRSQQNAAGVAADYLLQQSDPLALLDTCFQWHDRHPSWQRERRSLEAYAEAGLKGWTIEHRGEPVAYALGFPPRRGAQHFIDIAVHPQARLWDAGAALMLALRQAFPNAVSTLMNEPSDSVVSDLLARTHFEIADRQFEMTLAL